MTNSQRWIAVSVLTVSAALAAPASADWTGVYVGGELGAGWSNGDLRQLTQPAGPFDASFDGVVYGGHIGGQYQMGSFVFGVEGAYRGGDLDGNAACNLGNNDICQLKLNHIWNVNGRIGWALSSLMFYATGGYAVTSYDMTQRLITPGSTAVGGFDHNGYDIGGGIDKMISDNVIVGLEYQHFNFSDDQDKLVVSTGGTQSWKHGVDMDVVQGRISYKF